MILTNHDEPLRERLDFRIGEHRTELAAMGTPIRVDDDHDGLRRTARYAARVAPFVPFDRTAPLDAVGVGRSRARPIRRWRGNLGAAWGLLGSRYGRRMLACRERRIAGLTGDDDEQQRGRRVAVWHD